MQYGFLIDHRRCIGCHACTVACKAENDVPLGSFRTWVKYEEHGRFPAIKRHFAVLRCNHCTKAPCVTICPVNALEKRPDGIVDLDRDACIGCRACMQGCPYDAIYLNEDSGSAEKCHYCAHRVEQKLEPACVIVCPEQAIVSGDLHDPTSRIARMVLEHETLQRRTEQRTGPNVHYLGAEQGLLEPGSAERPSTYLWSERPPHKPEPWPASVPTRPDARVVLDAGHKVEWGWHVAAYLVTKGIAAGALMLAPFASALGLEGFAASWLPELVALAMLGLTTWLLVDDLARPKLFLSLLTRPNTKSWLVKGAWILIAATVAPAIALGLRLVGFVDEAELVRWLGIPLGAGVAGYTAFLFAQCEGRDLWQSRRLLPHLLVQGVLAGAAVLLPFAADPSWLALVCASSALAHLGFVLLERFGKHPTDNARQAAAFLPLVRLGRARALGLAAMLPALALAGGFTHLPALGTLLVLVGLYAWEHAYVRAGQLPPLS